MNDSQNTTPTDPGAVSLMRRFRKWFRRWSRALIAYRKPLQFAEWVNEQRCSVTIENDPSGQWRVRIGCLTNASVGRSIGEAMSREFWAIDQDPNWTWTCDYLESLNTKRSGGWQ